MSKYKRVSGDLYDIADRLKEIDASYFLVYNAALDRYEVHSDRNIHDTLCLVSPYRYLDQRLLSLVRETRRERARQLFEEMERANELVNRHALQGRKEAAEETVKEIVSFAKGGDLTLAQTEEIARRCAL